MKIKSKKPLVNFNVFWPLLKKQANKEHLKKGDWLAQSGLNYQRYSEFDKEIRDISARYFLKLIGGLNLKPETAEKALGHSFTESQRKLLQFEALVDSNREWLEKLLGDPQLIKITKSIIAAKAE